MEQLTKDIILKRFNEQITHILDSTCHDPTDEYYRGKVAGKLSASIRQSKAQGGDVRMPNQTQIYRLATILKDTKTWEDFSARIKKAFPTKKTLHNPYSMIERFGLDWKHSFDIPEKPQRNKPLVVEPKELEAVTNESTPVVPETSAVKYLTHEEYNALVTENAELRTLIKSLIKDHRHVDGRVVLIKEID